jgi:hypothetical protein
MTETEVLIVAAIGLWFLSSSNSSVTPPPVSAAPADSITAAHGLTLAIVQAVTDPQLQYLTGNGAMSLAGANAIRMLQQHGVVTSPGLDVALEQLRTAIVNRMILVS